MAAAVSRARRLHERGVAANAAGRPQQAARVLAHALRELDRAEGSAADPDADELRVRVLIAQTSAEFERGGLPAALGILDRAATIAAGLGDGPLIALCHSQRAMLFGRSGMMAEALPALDAAVGRLRALSPRDRWVVLVNRGVLHSERGALTAAAADLAAAEREAAAAGLSAERLMALHNRGYVAYLSGDLPQALDLMGRADRVDVEVSRAVSRLDHGRVLLEAGLIHEAVDILNAGAADCTDRRQLQVLGEIHLELARANGLLGEVDRALRLARGARDRFRRRGAPLWAARCEAVALRTALARGTRLGVVAAAADRLVATDEARTDPIVGHQAHLLAAQAHLELGAVEAATRHLDIAETLQGRAGAAGSLTTTLQHHQLRATAAVGEGDERRARRILRTAGDELVRRQALTASLDLRTAVALHGTRLAQLDLALALPRGPAAVLSCTERWRAATTRIPAVRPQRSPKLAEALAELRSLQQQVRDDPSVEQREVSAQRIAELQRRVRSLARTQGGGASATAAVTPAVLRERLAAEGTDLLSLVSHGGLVHGVGVVDGRLRLRRLCAHAEVFEVARRVRADLQVLAGHDLGVMHAAVWSSLQAGLEALDRMLIQPFGLGSGRVAVVPHRATAALPWPMLPSLVGQGVVVAPSATGWLRGVPEAGGADGAVGRSGRATDVRVHAMAGPGLELADSEVADVARCWPDAVVTRARSSSAAGLQAALAAADVVHVAAHGTHHQQNPMFASVRLADGPLFVHDLETEGVGAAHVVLSACDVGRSTVRPGDEPLGLAAGLLARGARSVLAAVCRVPDEVAAATMAAYHSALAGGLPSDLALAGAVSDLPPVAGAFVVTGAPWASGRAVQREVFHSLAD